MEQEKRQTEGHGVFGAFVFGIVIGVAITLLLTTKKGRRVLRTFTDEGMNKLGKWEDSLQKKEEPVVSNITPDVDEMMEAQDYSAAEEMRQPERPNHVSEAAVKHSLKHDESHVNGVDKSSGPRRMFKGAKKS